MKPKVKEEYYEDGSVQVQKWHLNGECHREDGPAIIYYNKDNSISLQVWCLDGNFHREDGPAKIWYWDNGSIMSQHWYLDNSLLKKEDFDSLEMIKKMNAFPLFTVKEIARLKLDKPI